MYYGLLAIAIPLGLYLGWPSTQWNFDGVACAAAIELGNPVYWFHAQHLLYGFLGAITWKTLGFLGFDRALPAIQLLSSLLSAIAAAFLYQLLLTLPLKRWMALILALSAAVSAVVWVWSIEAQVYPIGYLGLAGASLALLGPDAQGRGWKTGAWHGLAILGHAVHGLWVVPALFVLLRNRNEMRRYLLSVVTIVTIAYALVALIVLLPYKGGPDWLSLWMKGSLGLTADRSIAWHWPGWLGLIQWIQTTPQMWWGSLAPYGTMSISWELKGLTLLSASTLAALLWNALKMSSRSVIVRFSLIWIGVYALFFATWEPTTLCYRMTDVIPWTLLIAVGLKHMATERQGIILACGWLSSLAVINLATRAWPMHQIERNLTYSQTLTLVKMTPPNATYLSGGGLPWIYLLYFSGRSAWNANTLPENRLNTLSAPLYAHTSLLADSRMRDWIQNRSPVQIAPEIPWMELK